MLSQDNSKKSRESSLSMPHNISSQGVDKVFQWVIWHLTSINAMCVTKAFLRQGQDKQPSSVVWSTLCLQTQTLLRPAAPHSLSPLTVKPLPKQLSPVRKTDFSHLRGCDPAEPLFSPAGSDCGRNVDIADGPDISENQQHLCHFHPQTLGYFFSFKWFGSFLANLYILMILLEYQNRNTMLYNHPSRIWTEAEY